jgi:RNA polymerase sigma factor (sigma-70 family)
MIRTSDPIDETATAAGRISRFEDGGTATGGAVPGFAEWVTRLMHAHRGRLRRLARREGVRDEASLDCVQDAFHTFLLLPQARRMVESNEDSIRLLSVLVRNHARNRRRRHEIARPHVSGDETLALLTAKVPPVDELMAKEQEVALMIECLDRLGKLQRAVFSLRVLDEVAGEEVAAMLGLPPSRVAVLLHRAKQKLRSCLLSAGYRHRGGVPPQVGATAHRRVGHPGQRPSMRCDRRMAAV